MNSDSRSKGFSQVVRTCSAITGAVADVLDPLSIFALESAKQAREVVDVKKPNDKGHFLDSTSKRENIGYVSVVNDSAIEKDQKNEKKTDAGLSSEQDEDSIKFLTGEQKIMSLVDASIQTTPGHFMFVTLLMTNYRIAFIPTHKDLRDISAVNPSIHSWLQIPLACIDRLEKEKKSKDLNSSGINVVISCKDFRQHRVTIKSKNSTNGDYDIERAFSVLSAYAFPNNMRYLFAFSHSLAHHGQPVRPVRAYSALSEFSRMGVLDSNLWRQCTANSEYKLCNTYPQLLFAPKSIGDEEMHIVSNFRSGHRLPVLCWADQNSGVTMWRSSQPKAGVSGSCMQDEKLLDLLAKSSLTTRPNATGFSKHPTIREPLLHIVDLRSRASAMANRAAGAGYESQTNYPNTRLEFYNIPNIHGVRDSLRGLAQITLNPSANASNDLTFSKQVDDTMWLTNLRLVLKASWESAAFLSRGYPVLVHCSHGWDRTAQVCAIAQLLLDPFYRTIDGFKILVEKEWIGFGHPFQIRCCHSQDKQTRQEEQVSPIILQFIDAVWQIQRQHCQYFEFNSRYLLTIAEHIYSGRFGTFLFSNDYDRDLYNSRQQCADLWTYLHCNRASFLNPLYMHSASSVNLVASIPLSAASSSKFALLLPPLTQLLRNVTLWSDYYLRWSSVPSALFAPTVLSKQMYANGISRQLYFPSSDTSFSDEVDILTPSTDARTEGVKLVRGDTGTVKGTVKSSSDLDLCSMVSVDDFWEGAFRLEREHRIKLEDTLTQFRASQQLMVNNLKSFLFDRALELSEDDLNSILFDCAKQQSTSTIDVTNTKDVDGFIPESLDDFLTVDASDDLEKSLQQQLDGSGVALMEGDVDDEGGGDTTPPPDQFVTHDSSTEPTFLV